MEHRYCTLTCTRARRRECTCHCDEDRRVIESDVRNTRCSLINSSSTHENRNNLSRGEDRLRQHEKNVTAVPSNDFVSEHPADVSQRTRGCMLWCEYGYISWARMHVSSVYVYIRVRV